MELQALPFVRSSHTVTRTGKVPRPTPPTFNEANTGLDAAVCSRGALSDSEPTRSSMLASAAQCPWSTGVHASRAVSSGVDRGVPRSEGPLSLQVLPRPSQLKSRGAKARLRKRAFEGTPVIVDHLAQLRRKEQGFSTGYFGAPHEESCGYDDPTNIATVAERDFQMVPSSPSLKRLCGSAERGWLRTKQHTHAPLNSVLEPSAHELPLEDAPSQFQDNWAFFSAPQAAGIKWKSGESFLGSSEEEEGRVQKLSVDTGCDPVMFGLQEGTAPLTSSEGEGVASWEHHGLSLLPASLDALPTYNLNEGVDPVQQQSHNTDQAPLWPCDYSAGNEDGSRHVGLDRSRSIGRPTTDPHLGGVPSVPADKEDDHHSHTSSSNTRQHRHFGCNQEESPLIPWEE